MIRRRLIAICVGRKNRRATTGSSAYEQGGELKLRGWESPRELA